MIGIEFWFFSHALTAGIVLFIQAYDKVIIKNNDATKMDSDKGAELKLNSEKKKSLKHPSNDDSN